MSPTMSDELLVRRLAERVDRALPSMSLEPADVLGAGRRHRRRRMSVRVVGGLAVASVATFGALQLSSGRTPLPLGDVVQEPRPLGDRRTLEVAPGVIAANRPVEIRSGDGRVILLDLGFTTPGPGSTIAGPVFEQPLVLAPLPADQLPQDDGALSTRDAGVLFTHYSESDGLSARGNPLRWSSRDSAVYDVIEALPYSSFLELEFEDGSALRAGAVPPWLTDPRVYLYSEIQGAGGTDGTIAVELPTFRYDLADERLLFAARLTTVDPPSTYATVFVGGDGEVVLGNGLCAGWTLETCDPDQAKRIADAVGVDLDDDPAAPEPETGTLPAGVVEVAPGVVAAARPTERVTDDGSLALVLGLRAGDDPAARELAVVHNPRTGIWTPYGSGEVWVSRDVTLDIALLEGTDVKEALFWENWGTPIGLSPRELEWWGPDVDTRADTVVFDAPNPRRLAEDEGWATSTRFDDGTILLIGLVPADADPDALAQVTLRASVTGSDGSLTTVLELPVFDAPTADGRRMFAATIDATAAVRLLSWPLQRIPVPLVPATG